MGKTIFRCRQNKITMKNRKPDVTIVPIATTQPDPQIPYVYQLLLNELREVRKLLAIIASPPEKAYNGPG
jgi:hypothetical protein